MPTGYTYKVGQGKIKSFRRFALNCALAFGIAYRYRDDNLNELPKTKQEPDQFCLDKLTEVQKELINFNNKSEKQLRAMYRGSIKKQQNALKRVLKSIRKENTRYRTMLSKVNAWQPPTNEHFELKQFMIQQLTMSMHDPSYYVNQLKNAVKPFEVWRVDTLNKLEEDQKYYSDKYDEELVRCNRNNQWIKELYESL